MGSVTWDGSWLLGLQRQEWEPGGRGQADLALEWGPRASAGPPAPLWRPGAGLLWGCPSWSPLVSTALPTSRAGSPVQTPPPRRLRAGGIRCFLSQALRSRGLLRAVPEPAAAGCLLGCLVARGRASSRTVLSSAACSSLPEPCEPG